MTDQFQIGEKERYFLVFIDKSRNSKSERGGKAINRNSGKPVFGNSNWKISLGKRSISSERTLDSEINASFQIRENRLGRSLSLHVALSMKSTTTLSNLRLAASASIINYS